METAAWFRRQVNGDQTTFGHEPNKLNFGFRGKLVLVIDDSSDFKGTHIFNDIALAQGHAFFLNNLWFGGKNCVYIGGENTPSKKRKPYTIIGTGISGNNKL